jgi:DNA-binding NarL/FixJ family response regulator
VVVVSAFADSPTVHGALEAGAAGFLSKRTEEDELCRALLEVAAGRTVVSPDLHQSVFEQIQRRGRQERLSPREAEMLRLVADGHDHAEIGRRLALSPATVKTYLHRAYDKLGVSTSAAAVAEAMRRGLLR